MTVNLLSNLYMFLALMTKSSTMNKHAPEGLLMPAPYLSKVLCAQKVHKWENKIPLAGFEPTPYTTTSERCYTSCTVCPVVYNGLQRYIMAFKVL